MAIPGSHKQNFVAERIPEYVVDIGRPIDLKETRVAGVCPLETSVEQNAKFGKLLRCVFPGVFNYSR